MVNDVKNLTDFVIYSCKNLVFTGFFVIAPTNGTLETTTQCFQTVSNLRSTAVLEWDSVKSVTCFELSMGMSSDMDIALQHGADIIRVGTKIFGSR
jgi:PLP dependent protein